MARPVKRLLCGLLLGAALAGGTTFALSAAEPAAAQQTTKVLTIIDISELHFNTQLDDKQDFAARVKLVDDKNDKLQLTVESEWTQAHSPLNLILQASLMETGGRPVTRRVT